MLIMHSRGDSHVWRQRVCSLSRSLLCWCIGICDRFTRYSDGIQKTLNTGIVTTLNFNKQVAREVSFLTFAHELGHNMGSNVGFEWHPLCSVVIVSAVWHI